MYILECGGHVDTIIFGKCEVVPARFQSPPLCSLREGQARNDAKDGKTAVVPAMCFDQLQFAHQVSRDTILIQVSATYNYSRSPVKELYRILGRISRKRGSVFRITQF